MNGMMCLRVKLHWLRIVTAPSLSVALLILLGAPSDCAIAVDELPCLLKVKFDAPDGRNYRDEVTGVRVIAHNVVPMRGVDGFSARFVFEYRAGIASRVEIPLTEQLKQLDTANFSVELWFSPDEVAHAIVLTGGKTFAVRWRLDHRMWFALTDEDGASRLVQTPQGCISPITFPTPTWYHYLATYDGQEGRIYINGKLVARVRWSTKKKLQPLREPLAMGGEGWERYRGGVDELAIYGRALTAQEVSALYERECRRFKPAQRLPKEVAGTIDGQPYKKEWRRIPLKFGYVRISNTGQVGVTCRHRRWGRDGPNAWFSLMNADGMKQHFWKDVTGQIAIRYEGASVVELRGTTYHELNIHQVVEITPQDELKFRFEMWSSNGNAPMPTISYPFHLWWTAVPFVGYDASGAKVCGRIMDLAERVTFTRALEFNFICGGVRMLMRMASGIGYELPATREPTRWLGGYCTFYGRILPLNWNGWANYDERNPLALEFSVQLIPDEKPPILRRDDAREITPERPFDFSALYKPDASKPHLRPVGRDAPIFGIDEDIALRIYLPTPILRQLPKCKYTISEAFTGRVIEDGAMAVERKWWEFDGLLTFKVPSPSVYLVSVTCVDADGKVLAELTQEVAVAGPIPQPTADVREPLKLRLVDHVDCTRDDTHEFYSRSQRSKVVSTKFGRYRITMRNSEMKRLGTTDIDWFGYKLTLRHPERVHVVEVIYPDLPNMTMGINVIEPGSLADDGKPIAITRIDSGVCTGGVYPATKRMLKFRTIYFPTAKWCVVTIANIHCGDAVDETGAAASEINLYELVEPLPQLKTFDVGEQRLIGVYTESGELGFGSFGYDGLRGEWAGMHSMPPPERFYREHYRAIENLIRYMRYRGDNVYIYGAYRYRSARFPSRWFPPDHSIVHGYALDLLAKMFEYNGLKVIPAVQPNQPLPISRLYRCSLYEIVQGSDSVMQVSCDGITRAGHFGFMYANPFHPRVQAEWAKLAEEIAERYSRYASVPGIAWLTGPLWEPALLQMGYRLTREKVERYFFEFTYDDATMQKFAEELGVKLPGEIGASDRFRKRYEWLMKNARQQWIDFRCREIAELYKKLAQAVHRRAPHLKFYMLGQHPGFLNNEVIASPLETWRMAGFDPRYYRDAKKFVYCIAVPDGSGMNLYEHGLMPREWMGQVIPFIVDEELYAVVESLPATGRFLHRQFFENRLRFDPKRPWLFSRGMHRAEPAKLAHNFYPQPCGRWYLEDFARIMAYGAPELITWMWCDAMIPMGNEAPMREFASFYRSLPMGKYETVSRSGNVFVRKRKGLWRGAQIFYVVNLNRKPAVATVKISASVARDLVTGRKIESRNGTLKIRLKALEMRAFMVR